MTAMVLSDAKRRAVSLQCVKYRESAMAALEADVQAGQALLGHVCTVQHHARSPPASARVCPNVGHLPPNTCPLPS